MGVDEILGSDQVVALGYVTPASGVVVTPVTNFGLRDRDAGTLTSINSSVGVSKKLERIRENPKVALAFHTRHLSFSERLEYVLVQGTASLSAPDADYPRSIRTAWERFGGPVDVGPVWNWWLSVYNTRVAVTIAVERMMVWPDLSCTGGYEVHGLALGSKPAEQAPPANGKGPRVDHRRAAKRARRLPEQLLAWVDGDGYPVIVPVGVSHVEAGGIILEVPAHVVPSGGRRAGLVAHTFARYTAGQNQRKHTGWMEARPDGRVLYAPHTAKGYRMPASMFVYRLSAGAVTRRGVRDARRAGLIA
ncbi:MAG TPA: pyridoxamine 5'-phosphate oxidase family protein [Solirubrobacteraceae bacterium]|nr:pyridoxamine 5'-phosphate oxidase family protein [Solirubrobacteraceae bacterium]